MPKLSGIQPQELEFASQVFPWLTPTTGALELATVYRALEAIVKARVTQVPGRNTCAMEVELLRQIRVGAGRENTVLEFFKAFFSLNRFLLRF